MTTVVAKLFLAVKPHSAVFGQKDAQQALVIRKMVADLGFDVDVLVSPTVRDPDGLARSSRNAYLSAEERRQAPVLLHALQAGNTLITQGEQRTERVVEAIRSEIEKRPAAVTEYVEVVALDTLRSEPEIRFPALLAVAVRFGRSRLIDNRVATSPS